MDIQLLLYQYPHNIIISMLVGALVAWLILSRSHRKAVLKCQEKSDSRVIKVRQELSSKLDTQEDDIAQLEHRLMEADNLVQSLSQKGQLLAQEQQRFADLKSRYLNDIGRARKLLKTRSDAGSSLESKLADTTRKYQELHTLWDTERKRYASLITEKNQQISDLDSKLDGLQSPHTEEKDPTAQTYNHEQLEVMLVDLRQQLAERETEVKNLLQKLENQGAGDIAELDQIQSRLRNAETKIASKDREISRLRNQILQNSSAPAPPALPATELSATELAHQLAQNEEELEALKLQITQLVPASHRLRRLDSQVRSMARGEFTNEAALSATELELEQANNQLFRQQAQAQIALEKQAKAYQRQLNAKIDTIGRLNRQLQSRS